MERERMLEKLISEGLQIQFRDYFAIEEWLYKVYVALDPFPLERHRLVIACSDCDAAPPDKIWRGLEILNEALEHSILLRADQQIISRTENERLGQFR